MALSISGGNGNPTSQGNTQSPQSATGSNAPGAATTGKVQPDAAGSQLSQSGGGGVSLANMPLTVVNLNTSAQTVTKPPPAPAQPKHHLNPVLLAVIVSLVLLALAFFWTTMRSAKNTTHY